MTLDSAPFYAEIDGEPVGQAYWITAADGVRLRIAHWPLEGAKGTVLLFPGRTEYVEKYAINAADLAKAGYATVSIDWRGQGEADRLVVDKDAGHVADFADYQLDVDAFMAALPALGVSGPLHLLAHSMGGCIGLRALMNGLDVQSAAFTGPMWNIGLPWYLRIVAHVVCNAAIWLGQGHRYAPGTGAETYVLKTAFEDNALTKTRAMYERLQVQARKQPQLCIGGPTLRWLLKALHECADMAKQPAPDVPCLVALGTDEAIVSPSAITRTMARWPKGELMMVDKGEHEVLMEGDPMRADVTKAILALYDAN